MAIFIIYGIIIFVIVELVRRVYLPSVVYRKRDNRDSVQKINDAHRDWWNPEDNRNSSSGNASGKEEK